MSKPEPKFKVGQDVMVTGYRDTGSLVTVARVGRLYVYAGKDWLERKFDIERGNEAGDYNSGAIFTLEEWADRENKALATDALRELGIEIGYRRTVLTTATGDQLWAIVAIFKGNGA